MTRCRGPSQRSIGRASMWWTTWVAADRRLATVHGGEAPRESVDPGLGFAAAHHDRRGVAARLRGGEPRLARAGAARAGGLPALQRLPPGGHAGGAARAGAR